MAALRDVADPVADHVTGRDLAEIAVAEPDPPPAAAHQAHDPFKGGRLAGPGGAHGAGRLARADDEADRPDGTDSPVVHGQAVDAERARIRAHRVTCVAIGGGAGMMVESPRYASTTAGVPATSAGVPSAMTAPLASTVTRSHSDITRPMLCSMSTTVTPLSRMDRTISASWRTSSPLSPAAGSSSSSRRGELAIARAISMRRWMPYGRAPGDASANPARPKRVAESSAWRRSSRSWRQTPTCHKAYRQIDHVRVRSSATSRFSLTVRLANRRRFWNVRATPRLDSWYGRMPETTLPSRSTWPPVALYRPLTTLNSVVFPEPLGSTIPRISPAVTVSVTSSSALSPRNRMLTWRISRTGTAARAAPAPGAGSNGWNGCRAALAMECPRRRRSASLTRAGIPARPVGANTT